MENTAIGLLWGLYSGYWEITATVMVRKVTNGNCHHKHGRSRIGIAIELLLSRQHDGGGGGAYTPNPKP